MNHNTTFHGSDLEAIAKHYQIDEKNIINFAANVNPLGISKTLKDELSKNLDILSAYPDRDYVSLRETIGEYCNADPDNIIVGNGSTELISLLISNIQAKKALLIGPTYSEYEKELQLVNCTLEEYRLSTNNDFELNCQDLFLQLENGFDFLIICNPNNPTGTALNTVQLDEIFEYCLAHSIFVMLDETYIEFSSNIETFSAISLTNNYSNVMVLRGVSKFFAAPGLRMGYGITSNQKLLTYLKKHQNPWSLNSIASFAGEIMFTDQEYIHQTYQLIQEEKLRCYEFLDKIPEIKYYKTEANFILIQFLQPQVTAASFFDYCIQHGLLIRNCDSFFQYDGAFIRFCFMNPNDNTRLLDCLQLFIQS